MKTRILFLITLLCAVVVSLQNIQAATITVTNTNDSGTGSLRQALTDAIAGDTINFSVSGTILLASTLPVINITLTIDATGQNITISGNDSVQVMRVNTGATLTLEGLTIVHGNGFHGGAISNGGTLSVTNTTFSLNSSSDFGGAIENSRTLTVTNSTFTNNHASSGGAIFNGRTLVVTNSTFSGNDAGNGGGIYSFSTLTVTSSTFSGNTAGSGIGSAIYTANTTLNLNTSILGNNSATSGGDIAGAVSSGDYNLVGNTSGTTLSGTHNITGVDPLLGPLQPNGGPTFTFSLLGGSPAIDAGTDLTALNGAIDDMTTGLTVTDATGIVAGVGFAIQIDSEQMIVDAKSTNTLTVMRGANSTTPTAHSSGAAVNPAFDQRDSGFARKVGSAVDIGAFEVQPTPTPTPTPTPIQDFSISTSPSSKTVLQGGSTSYTVTTAVTSGSAQTISLQLSGLPAGASGSFNPNFITSGGTSTLTINAGTAASGTYFLTITGVGSVNTHFATAQLIITVPPQNDFSISVSPPSQTVVQGASTSYTVSTAVTSGNPETIALSLSGLPNGASGSFTSNPITTGTSTTLTINAGTAASGTYTLTVTGLGSTNAHSATAQLIIISAVTPTPTPTATPTPSYAAQIQQPINPDGSSVFNVHRGVVPARFTLTLNGVATCALPPATIAVTRTAGGTIGPVDESDYNGPADNGSNFRIDSCQYVYNLSASALGVGTYRVDIIINTQVVGSASFGLR